MTLFMNTGDFTKQCPDNRKCGVQIYKSVMNTVGTVCYNKEVIETLYDQDSMNNFCRFIQPAGIN